MPRTFQEKYPNEMRNLRLNSRKLTTPFDIHETLKHLLNFEPASEPTTPNPFKKSTEPMPRGISLLKYISPNRSCDDAQIEAHWCSCLNWIEMNITSANKANAQLVNSQDLNELVELNEAENDKSPSKILETPINSNSTLNLTLISNKYKTKINYNEYKIIREGLKYFSKSVLQIAKQAIEFINSLIDKDLKIFCEKVRLHSIQKLSRLDLNRKLLAFKKSKDIHGREALFEDLNSFDSNNLEDFLKPIKPFTYSTISLNETTNLTSTLSPDLSVNKNLTLNNLDTETIFQIALTTWPGNATYELSFKYNRFTGVFKFNKNEISRINNYNDTSSCMLNKRPDLRQFCYCKYSFN